MPMINPPIGELLSKVDCRYTLAVEAAKRARQLVAGAQPLIMPKDTKPLVIAIEEINRGLITYTRDESVPTPEMEGEDMDIGAADHID